jgi:hypothetical protein
LSPEVKKEDWVYINDVIHAIEELYTSISVVDIVDNVIFIAIAKYFEAWLISACSDNSMQLNKFYPIFIVPDEWRVETNDVIQQIIVPLLTKAGIHFDTEDYRDRMLFIGEMEAKMAALQLGDDTMLLPFIHNENRCIMYTYYIEGLMVKLKATYFQVKEDYVLRLFNEKYYSLNIISTHDIPIFDEKEEDSMKHVLIQFIFKKLLKMDHLITTILDDQFEPRSVADYILHEIILIFSVCLLTF